MLISSDCFPWSPKGPLCPVLQDPSVWLKLFDSPTGRRNAKIACKRSGYAGVLCASDDIALGKALCWSLNDAARRAKFAKSLEKFRARPLHIRLFSVYWGEDDALKQAWPLEAFCRKEVGDLWFLEIDRFKAWLAKRPYKSEHARSIAIVSCAFAVLQSHDAPAILAALLEHDPDYARWMLTPQTTPVPRPPEPTSTPPPAYAPLAPTPSTNPACPNNHNTFDIANIRLGQDLLNAFLTNYQHLRDLAGDLPSEIDNFRLPYPAAQADLLAKFREMLTSTAAAATTAGAWLDQLADDLQSLPAEAYKVSEPAFETLRIQMLQPRKTFVLLYGVSEQLTRILVGMAGNALVRAERLLSMVSEINNVQDLLNRPHYNAPIPLQNANLLQTLQLLPDVEARLKQARSDWSALLLETKRNLESRLDTLVARTELTQFAPDLATQVSLLRTNIQACSSATETLSAQQAMAELENTLKNRPETRNLSEITTAALTAPNAETILPVAQTLNARGRHAEALSILSCLQLAAEIESAGPDDFSPLIDELLLSGASIAQGGNHPFLWIDGIFQQTWLRSLVRRDIANHAAWERLAVAFVVQEHSRGTEMELDLFYRLDYQTAWPRDRFPLLGQLLNSIATRHRTRVVAEPPSSPLRNAETRIAKTFAHNHRGDYIQQAAAGDAFYAMERFNLFPSMERLLDDARRLCRNEQWKDALTLTEQEPEKLLNDACRAAGIEPATSPFYRRQVLDSHNGYLPRFLCDLRSLIEASQTEHETDKNFVVVAELLNEMESLAAQDKHFERYWVAVRQTLTYPSSPTARSVSSAEELFASLVHACGPVATLAPDYVVSACSQDVSPKPTLQTLAQMLSNIATPPPDFNIPRLQKSECFRHALNILQQVPPPLCNAPQRDTTDSRRSHLEQQLGHLQDQIHARWNALQADPTTAIDAEDYESALADGRFTYLKSILAEAEARAARASANTRAEVAAWLRTQLERLAVVKRAALTAESSDEWLGSVLEYCASAEKILLLGERDLAAERPLALNRSPVETLLTALQFVVENNAQTFTEVQGCLAEFSKKPSDETSPTTVSPLIPIPEVAQPWEALRAATQLPADHTNKYWEDFARNFCDACRLHCELHQTLKFSAIKGFRWGRYTTRFLAPRSSWLDRDVILYICIADKTPPSELEHLALQLDYSRECLNVVFVPQGFARLSRMWKYSSSQSHYLLVGDELLSRICGAHDPDGKARHDVPLRQALHQSAESLASIGLFKSEGYVHHRKNIFVGRELALKQLAQQPASAIWGGRRTGKTSLLQALSERLRQPSLKGGPYNVVLVYGDKATGDPDLGIARAIAKDLNLQEPDTLEHFGSLMQEVCSRERVAVLIDEMDRYIQLSREAHGHTSFPLARLLRGLSQRDSHNFKLVYAGFKQLYREVRIRPGADPSDPFKNILQPVTKDFRDLDLGEVQEFLQIAFVDMLGVEMELAVPRLVTEKTSGHPAFLQRFCERLLARLSRRRHHESHLRLTCEDVEATYLEETPLGSPETAFIDYVSETLGWNVSHLEHAVLLAMSIEIRSAGASERREFSGRQIADLLKEWCSTDIAPPDHQDLQNAIHMLSMTKMLTPSGPAADPRYHVTYPAYIDFMSRLEKLQRIELFKSLREYHKEEKGQLE